MKNGDRIGLILSLLKNDRIIIIDGRLSSKDEAALIRETMSRIDEGFHGIELGVLYDNSRRDLISRSKYSIANMLAERSPGLTIIGPASIISEMRQYPEDVVIHFGDEYLKRYSKASGRKNNKNDRIK